MHQFNSIGLTGRADVHGQLSKATSLTQPRGLCVDFQSLSYLIDTLSRQQLPVGPLAEQRLALVRILFYDRWGIFVTPNVVAECARIPDVIQAKEHNSWLTTLIPEATPVSPSRVEQRTKALQTWHDGRTDCQILAEAEEAQLPVLLTINWEFLRRLRSRTHVQVLSPLQYWDALGIPRGAAPRNVPHNTNPLATQIW